MSTRSSASLILAVIAVVLAILAYGFSYAVVDRLSQKAAELDTEIRIKNEETLRMSQAKETLETLLADEERMRGYLIRQEEIVPFLGRLEVLGSSLGSSLEVVSVSEDLQGTRERILVSVKISGSFQSVVRTLGVIEYGPYDSAITHVTLDTPAGGQEQSSTWSAVATFALGTQPTNAL